MTLYAGKYSEHLQDRYGNGYRNALVAVQTLAAAPVTLYADRVKTAYVPASGLAANEIKADTKGNLIFFADPGNYQIAVTPVGGSTLATFPISILPDPLEPTLDSGAYRPGGTDVALLDGGTGASTASSARTNLGAAAEIEVVKLTGTQSIEGEKYFTSPVRFPNGPHIDITAPPFSADQTGAIDAGPAIQAAHDAMPTAAATRAEGGHIFFPKGKYKIATPVLLTRRGLRITGEGSGANFTESDISGNFGTVLDVAPGIDGIQFGSGALSHAGPVMEFLHVREIGAGQTSHLVTIQSLNRFTVANCTFRGGLSGLRILCSGGTTDASWGMLHQICFNSNDVGLRNEEGAAFDVFGGEYSGNNVGIMTKPKLSLTGRLRIFGPKFDGGTIGIQSQAYNVLAFGLHMERCATAIEVSRDVALHSLSGLNHVFVGGGVGGTGTETGVSVGEGCTGGILLGFALANSLAVKMDDPEGNWLRVDTGGGLMTKVVATASLPAASTAMNGTVLIEEAGADNRNLILYAGGQRFRIDGGVSF